LFGVCLAHACLPALVDGGAIFEFGAGSGALAADILSELARLEALPKHYYILEVSAELRARQAQTLQARVPHLAVSVQWLDALPQDFCGAVIANEVLDAMPVRVFHQDEMGAIFALGVSCAGQDFALSPRLADENLRAQVAALALSGAYTSEINPYLPGWLRALSESMARGLVLLIDYGFPRREYYHPQRCHGTLMCHYRHHSHADPFFLPGLQDITAHVDFTAVAEAALAADLCVSGYTSQADFLLGNGLTEHLARVAQEKHYVVLAQGVKKLLMPAEMGELFKVMALSKDPSLVLTGFARDRRNAL
jgi:SAM-dependent MidA family methyltransferase